MEALDQQDIITEDIPAPEEQLSQLFGNYKAEWLEERLFDLFTDPGYFSELTTSRPCMLIGGRGTGKTTVLRGLSYEGQFALSGRKTESIKKWPYYGLYYRVDTNRVTAFQGPELNERQWIKIFGHYINLLLCDLVFQFLHWYEHHTNEAIELDSTVLNDVAASLHLPEVSNLKALTKNFYRARVIFEASVNNIADRNYPELSTQGQPISILIQGIRQLVWFHKKHFFFILDEYENFLDYQQQVVNTLIKHSGQGYTFKVGVRELGFRRRTTLNENEQLISPADYVRINIVEKISGKFKQFALAVSNGRLSQLQGENIIRDTKLALPGLTEDEEAELLGVKRHVKSLKEELQKYTPKQLLSVLDEIPPLQAYLIKYWAKGRDQSVDLVFRDFLKKRSTWNTRYGNYKHSLLYDIKRGKTGVQRYYSGWDVFSNLAAGNIRYFLELVEQSLLLHLRESKSFALSKPAPPKIQTIAAQNVGKKNLSELEGLTVLGAKLTKLLLGLGRVFGVMAATSSGHTPEANQFHLSDDETRNGKSTFNYWEAEEVEELLKSAVMHLALLRSPGNKLQDQTETKEYDYMVHPVFSAFFVFSYRKKRKIVLTEAQLIGLVKNTQEAIRDILTHNNRNTKEDVKVLETLPEQLLLFEAYYGGRS